MAEAITWQETPFFTDRERAALAWTEAITLLTSGHASDEAYEQVRQSFSAEELVNNAVQSLRRFINRRAG